MNPLRKLNFILLMFLFFTSCTSINHYTTENNKWNTKIIKRGKWIEYCEIDTTFNKRIREYNLNPYSIDLYANCVNNYKKGIKHGKSMEFYSNGFYAIGKYYKGLKNGIWYIFDSKNTVVSIIFYNACPYKNNSQVISMMVIKEGMVVLSFISSPDF